LTISGGREEEVVKKEVQSNQTRGGRENKGKLRLDLVLARHSSQSKTMRSPAEFKHISLDD